MDRARARYEQGLAAYQSGQSVMHLMDVSKEIHAEHETVRPSIDDEITVDKLHDDITRSEHAFVAGFADGLIRDIRAIIDSPTLSRRGQTA